MIKLLKNREVRIPLIIQLVISLVFVAFAFNTNTLSGYITLALSFILIFMNLLITHMRYKKIASLSECVNKLLHGDNTISLENYSEGELGILHSEIYKMTVRLREQQHKLQNDKIYLSDSIADISHQLRTPLTSINLMIQLMSEPNVTESRKQQLTYELYGLLSRIDWLITSLLKISKLDAGTVQFKNESISLSELINKSCSTLLVPIELRNQTLEISANGNFCGDINWTSEAIGNVVKNCMEHTGQGGKIEIHADENVLYSEIVISDNGCGIESDDLPHIFERFYKGKNSDDKSFGVGLALARMIITNQNGTVKAENVQPHGASFTIRFYKETV